mgnify:CR=1 FL=1
MCSRFWWLNYDRLNNSCNILHGFWFSDRRDGVTWTSFFFGHSWLVLDYVYCFGGRFLSIILVPEVFLPFVYASIWRLLRNNRRRLHFFMSWLHFWNFLIFLLSNNWLSDFLGFLLLQKLSGFGLFVLPSLLFFFCESLSFFSLISFLPGLSFCLSSDLVLFFLSSEFLSSLQPYSALSFKFFSRSSFQECSPFLLSLFLFCSHGVPFVFLKTFVLVFGLVLL